jgi:hypothetical protein
LNPSISKYAEAILEVEPFALAQYFAPRQSEPE